MEDWEIAADNPSLLVIPPKTINVNKWEGEDEDDVKDSWEDEEEKKDEEKVEVKVVKKPKKSLQEKIAEKERQMQLELEAKQKEREDAQTLEQKLAEKLQLQKIQEEADLRAAMDTFGVTDKDRITGIDSMHPTNKTEFVEFSEVLSKKIGQFKGSEEFPGFIEELIRSLCVNLNSNDLQKIKKTVDNVYTEKQKIEKEKSKKGGKGKSKARLRMEGDNANISEYGYADPFDYDDFINT